MKDSRIVLIHATQLAIPPVAAAFAQWWPQAECMNLLDDRLAKDLAKAGALNAAMVTRMVSLAQYAKAQGANGILFTCSAFGPAIEEAKRAVVLPTLKPNEAMFDEALDICAQLGGARRVGLLTTFAPAAQAMHEELLAAIADRGLAVTVSVACAVGAMEALNAGEAATHDKLILDQALTMAQCDVLLLGQFSMARTQSQVAEATAKPVLTSPASAVRRLKAVLADKH